MTTASWNTPISHTSDATFRLWGSELSARLLAIGLVQTADTGQINWVTVTRPGVNTAAGYEIWRFNDSIQGTAPIFMKVEYGTGSGVTGGGLWITVATGSNGSGTLTGQSTIRTLCFVPGALTDAATNRQSFGCATEGFAGVAGKFNSVTANIGAYGFLVCRTVDATGATTNVGFVLYSTRNTNGAGIPCQVQAVRTAAPAQTFTTDSSGLFSFIVHGVTTSVDGANTQAYMHWMPSPKVLPVVGACTMITAEAAFGTTFSTTLVGSTPRTYISTASLIGNSNPTSTVSALCMLYE